MKANDIYIGAGERGESNIPTISHRGMGGGGGVI